MMTVQTYSINDCVYWKRDLSDMLISREKNCRVIHYTYERCLYRLSFASKEVWEIKPIAETILVAVSNQKPLHQFKKKVIKIEPYLSKEWGVVSGKYWENGSLGLSLHAKAFFDDHELFFYDKNKQGTRELRKQHTPSGFVMHRYDGNLQSIVCHLTTAEKIEAMFQISQGIATLNRLGMAHGDLALKNILYDRKKNRYDLADFGFSYLREDQEDFFESKVLEDLDCLVQEFTLIMKQKRLKDLPEGIDLETAYSQFTPEIADRLRQFFDNYPEDAEEVAKIFSEIRELFIIQNQSEKPKE